MSASVLLATLGLAMFVLAPLPRERATRLALVVCGTALVAVGVPP